MSEDLVRPVKTGMEENQIREMEEELRRFAPPDQEQEPPDDTLDPLVGPDQFEPSPIITDVARGITELPTQTLGGVRDATENTLQAVAGVGQFLNDTLGTGSQSWLVDEDAAQKFEEAVMEHRQAVTGEQGGEDEDFLPEVSEPASVTGGLIRSISQFATGFIPALRGIQRATGARASLSAGGIAQTEAAAGISGALVFDPHEQRLSDLIQSYPELENPITEALASDEDDSAVEGRFKNVLEGLGLGVGAQGLEIAARGLTKGVRAIKANRREKGFEPTRSATDDEPLVQSLGDPNGELLTTDLTGSVGAARRPDTDTGETTVSELIGRGRKRQMPFKINWAVVSEPNGLEEVLQRTGSVFARRIDKARRGKMSDERLDELAQQQLDSLANETGLTPDDITRIHGEGLRAEQIHAMKWVLEDATATLQETAERAANSADPADMFAFKKMKEAHTAVFARLQGEVSEAGRSLRASRIPTGSKEKQIADLSAAVSGGVGEGPESMRRLARAIAEVDEAETVNKALKPGIGKRINDAIIDVMYFNLLSGYKTHIINTAGSGSNLAWQIGERAMAARLARAGSRTDGVELGEASEMLYGLVQSFGPALKAAGRSFKTGEFTDPLGKVEGRRLVSITPENFPIGKGVEKVFSKFSPEGARVSGQVVNKGIEGLGQIVSLTSRALMSQDEFWKTMAQTAEMNARALRTAKQEGLTGEASLNRMQEILENPSTVDLEAGQNFGRDITFTRELGELGSRIQRLANHNLGMRFFVPFPRVVGNLLKWAGTRSPLGWAAQNVRRQLRSGGPERDLALARMGMGTMLGMFAVDMALRGKVTGAAPFDDELRSTWLREHQEFSIKIGDEWYGYDRADPFGLILGPMASYAQLAGEFTPQEREDYVAAFLLATNESILNKTWLRSVTEGIEAITAPDRSLEKFQETAAGLLIPTGVAQVTQVLDPVWREANGAMDAMKNRVYGWGELPAHRNVWGEKMLSQHGWGGQDMDIVPHDGELEEPGSDLSMQDFMPFSRFIPQKHPINLWMYENRVGLDRPKETQAGAELTPEQYSRFVELQGNAAKGPIGLGLRDTMNALIEGNHPRSSVWRSLTDGPEGGKAKMFKRYVSFFRQLARVQLAQEFPDFKQRVEASQMESNEALMRTIMNPDAGEVQE